MIRGVNLEDYKEIIVGRIVLTIVGLDEGIRQELTEISGAMRKIMNCDRRMNDVLSRSNRLERFIWILHPKLARLLCPVSRSPDSAFCRLYRFNQERVRAEEDIKNSIESIASFIQHLITILNEPAWKEYLPEEYLEHVGSIARKLERFQLDVRQLRQYSSRVPRITPTETDMAVFINLRKENPANDPAFLEFLAYLKVKGRDIDESARKNAEEKRLRFKEERRAINQRFNEDLNPVVLRAALKESGIDSSSAE